MSIIESLLITGSNGFIGQSFLIYLKKKYQITFWSIEINQYKLMGSLKVNLK